jgi:hypothetical protein
VKTKEKPNVATSSRAPKPGPACRTASDRGRKGANDPIRQFNRYSLLEDDHGDNDGDEDMEYHVFRTKSLSPRKKKST